MDIEELQLKILIPLLILVGLDVAVPYMGYKYEYLSVLFPALAILLIITVVLAVFIRTIPNDVIKIVTYMLAGFASYWIVGSAYLTTGGDPRYMFTTFYHPIILFSIANAAAVLITVNDGVRNGQIFSGMGFTVVLFGIASIKYMINRPDIILALAILWLLTAILWPRMFEKMIHPSYDAMAKTKNAIKVVLMSLPLYMLLFATYMFVSKDPTMNGVITNAQLWIATQRTTVIKLIAQSAWRYIIFHLVGVAAMSIIYEQVLRALKTEKKLLKTGEIIYKRKEEEKKPEKEEKKKEDSYAELITELKKFVKKLDKVDRLTATQLMSRFKNEYSVLSAKYETESKETVEKILKRLEQEMEKRFG